MCVLYSVAVISPRILSANTCAHTPIAQNQQAFDIYVFGKFVHFLCKRFGCGCQ